MLHFIFCQYILDNSFHSTSIEKPKVCKTLPNATIQFYDWENGISYYNSNLWINENFIIIESDTSSEEPKYKIIEDYKVDRLKELIQKYTTKK